MLHLKSRVAATIGVLSVFAAFGTASAGPEARPNILHIFADDMGWGSVGAYGSTTIETPHLDALADAGMVFHRAYAATVCAPSRAMLLTGFHNGHTYLDRNANIRQGFRAEDISVAEMIGEAGYTTAILGKWGFGGDNGEDGPLRSNPSVDVPDTLPQNHGYDYFYGYLSHRRAHSYRVDSLWTTREPPEEAKYQAEPDTGLWLEKTGNSPADSYAAYTMDLIGWKAEEFIRDQADDDEPFYLQLNHLVPHFDLDAIEHVGPLVDLDGNVIAPAGLGVYADHPRLNDKERNHAAMITRMDASIGAVMRRLQDPKADGDSSRSLLENTIIIFTSDNGTSPEDGLGLRGIRNLDATGGLRGGKRDLWEGGIRVPLIVRWDGYVEPGSTSDHLTDLADFFATTADLVGGQGPVGMDGISILPTLTGQGIQRDRGHLIFEHHEWPGPGPDPKNRAARWTIFREDLKLIKFNDGSLELYDLIADRTENNPLDLEEHASLVEELQTMALVEGVEEPDGYAVEYAEWTGQDGAQLNDRKNWSADSSPRPNWSAPVVNRGSEAATASAETDVRTLGFEVRGATAPQTVMVDRDVTVEGRNEVRISGKGRLHLNDATVRSSRWIDLLDEAVLTGRGRIEGNLDNAAAVAPGWPDGLPKEEPRMGVATGVIPAADFHFRGQDEAPMGNVNHLDENLRILSGVDFGPGIGPRRAGDAGDEFNVAGHGSRSLAEAIRNEDYLTFTIRPVHGLEMTLDAVEVNLWRNGPNAATQFAILTSIGGFEAEETLGVFEVNDVGSGNQHRLKAAKANPTPVTGPVEVRVYGWGANGPEGNTHFNGLSLSAGFTSVPTENPAANALLHIEGTYTQRETGLLRLALSGNEAGEFGALEITGDVKLDGVFELVASDGFAPEVNDRFQILSWSGDLEGKFRRIEAFDPGEGLYWDFGDLYAKGVARIVAEPNGY